MKKQKNLFGFLPLSFAFIFLFNPNLNIVDILPDFFGYAIICAVLSKLADMNEDIAVASKGFMRALFADVIKVACIFVVFSTPNPNEQNTLLLLISFIFATLELLLLIPAFKALFGGLMTLGYKYPNTAILGKANKNTNKNYTEKVRSLTFFFLIVKVAAYALPEFAVLSTQRYDDTSSTHYLYDYIGLLRSFAIIFCLVVGVIWFLHIRAYFSRVAKDKEFVAALTEEYNVNVLPRESLFARKAIKLISLLFCVAAILCIDFRLDNYNVIVDTIAAIVLIISALATKKYTGKPSKTLLPFVVYAVASLVSQMFEYSFFTEYYYGAIWRNDAAFFAYRMMLMWAVIDALAFLFAVYGMVNMLREIVKNHTGFSVPGASLNVGDKIERVHDSLTKKTYLLYVAAILLAASDLFYDFFAATINFVGLINVVFNLVFITVVISVTGNIKEEVESKYMLE